MCGRYLLTSPLDSMRNTFGVDTHANIPARYNIAPTQPVLIIRRGDGTETHQNKTLSAVEWGLVPEWAKEKSKKPLINARVETVAEKPSFRSSIKRRRCLVPADGWYEWRTENGRKQPYLIRQESRKLMAFAGIWSLWQGPAGDYALETMAILTEPAIGPLKKVHHRKPIILPASDYAAWLQAHDPLPRGFLQSFGRFDENEFDQIAVSAAMNSPRKDDQSCIDPVDTAELTNGGKTDDRQISLF